MKNKSWIANLLVLFCLSLGLLFYITKEEHQHTHSHEKAEEDFERGPHRGRLLQEGDFQTEVTIFEPEGVPPKFRIYFYDKNKPVDPSEVSYKMTLERINRTENIPFKTYGEFLESSVEAKEPHSFKVKVEAHYQGKAHHWEYESYEGRVQLTAEAIAANGIKIETAKPETMTIKLNVMGKIMPNEEETVHISPRFAGVVKKVYKKLGDAVKKGEKLAVIESNESLQNFEVKSELNGIVIHRNINLGMNVSTGDTLFVVSDLRTVWADFNIYRYDLPQVKIGDAVQVKSLDGTISEKAVISYISPIGHESTQSVIARAVLDNLKEVWKPGLFISGEITIDKLSLKVAVKDSALQTFRDWDIVFLSVGDSFEVAPVQIGRRNQDWVEIISGISPGERYVTENSYILKADLEKESAEHDH